MYSAGPPRPAKADSKPLRVSRAGRRVFEGTSDSALDPMLRVYLSDMVRPYGLALREDLLDRGSGHSYGEMAGALLRETTQAGKPVDLIVLAFAIHDMVPGRSTAAHLSHLCPGSPMAFAVCDQGAAAPFTGLRLIREYARTDSCRLALLVVAEQATLPYDAAAPAAIPARHAAVTLLCGESGPGRLGTVRQHADVAPEPAADLLARELAALSAGRGDVTLVAGNGLRCPAGAAVPSGSGVPARAVLPVDTSAVDQVLIAPPGQPCTGVWWELAGGLPGWAAEGRRVLLADYDPMLRYLCVSAIDVEVSPAAAAPRLTARQAR